MGEHNLISESGKKNLVDKVFILKLETLLSINTICAKQTFIFLTKDIDFHILQPNFQFSFLNHSFALNEGIP